MRFGIDGLRDDLREHRDFALGRVPAYARLLDLLLDSLFDSHLEKEAGVDVAARLEEAWRGRGFAASYERPLLIVASLRFVALGSGSSHPLYGALVDPGEPSLLSAERLVQAFRVPAVMQALRERHVQTNETSRAVAWLWIAQAMAQVCPAATLSLFDIGASAGLNLVADRLHSPWSDEQGRALLRGGSYPSIVLRRGYDRAPLDADDASARDWLRACVWVGQQQREQRLRDGLEAWSAARASARPPEVRCRRLEQTPADLAFESTHAIAYQTLVRDYLSPAERTNYEAGMRAWLARHPGRALWVELELAGDGAPPERSMLLIAHGHSPRGPSEFSLARCHPHPDRLSVDRAEEARLHAWLHEGADWARGVG